MSSIPGLGLFRGMALTLRRMFAPPVTIRYPETPADVAVHFRGRLQLLYDEHGALKCETCFQCAQACPVECIDMGGTDTRGRYSLHWGAAETYGERREESALRRSGREVPDPTYSRFEPVDPALVDTVLERHGHDPRAMLAILEAVQEEFEYLPVAALKRISHRTGAWYAMVYGTASYYRHLRLEHTVGEVAVCRCTACLLAGGGRLAQEIGAALGTELGSATPDGRLRFGWCTTHLAGAAAPLVTLDGEPQPEVSARTAAAWASGLAGRGSDSRPVK
jgi:NADH:ubiquinone oxidoreductase subunit E/NAD-dependent dihydropyrimidine dehydrogenase PreA subunit